MFLENWPDGFQVPDRVETESAWLFDWRSTRSALDAGAVTGMGHTADTGGDPGARVELGSPALPTISLHMQQVPADTTTRRMRTSANQIFCVVGGRRLASRALSAVRSNDVAGTQSHFLVLAPDGDLDSVLILSDVRDLPSEAKIHFRYACKTLVQMPAELVLLALQAVGVSRVRREKGVVELRNLSFRPAAVLETRALQSRREEETGDAALFEEIQGRRVEGRGTVVLRDLPVALEDRDRDPALGEQERGGEPHRASSHPTTP